MTERIVSQLLTEMDGLEDLKGVVVIGATNRPDIVDEGLLRPGRFDRLLEIPLPDNDARKEVLKIHTSKKPLDKTVSLDKLVELTKGYSGADIAALVNAAACPQSKNMSQLIEVEKQNLFQKKSNLKNLNMERKVIKSPWQYHLRISRTALKKIKRKVRVPE